MVPDMTRNPILIVSALLASLGPLVGNGLYAGPAGLSELRDGLPAVAHVAYALEITGFLALAVLLAWFTVHLWRPAPVAAVTTALAGGAMVAVKLGSAAPLMVAVDRADDLDPQTAAVLLGLNGMSFVVGGLLLSVAFLAAGAGLLRTSAPRWLAWWPVLAGALGTVAGAVGITRPDAYLPIPFLLLLVWLIALAIASATGPATGPGRPREIPAKPTARTTAATH
jgi:hypothetical protein